MTQIMSILPKHYRDKAPLPRCGCGAKAHFMLPYRCGTRTTFVWRCKDHVDEPQRIGARKDKEIK